MSGVDEQAVINRSIENLFTELKRHVGHDVSINLYTEGYVDEEVTVECNECYEIIQTLRKYCPECHKLMNEFTECPDKCGER